MQVSFYNPTPFSGRVSVPIATPYAVAKSFPDVCTLELNGKEVLCRKQQSLGTHTTLFRAQVDLLPSQNHHAKIRPEPQDDEQFVWHPWVMDDPSKLIPKFFVGRVEAVPIAAPVQTKRPDEVEFRLKYRADFKRGTDIKKVTIECFITFASNSHVADFHAIITWSDPLDPAWDLEIFESISIRVGEYLKLDYGKHNKMATLRPIRDPANGDWVHIINKDSFNMVEGCTIPLHGRLLCFKNAPPLPGVQVDPADTETGMTPTDLELIQTSYIAEHYPIYGIASAETWDGHWLGHGNVAEALTDPVSEMARFVGQHEGNVNTEQPEGYYQDRILCCNKVPAGTGDQEDFNSTKGSLALRARDSRWLYYALHSVDCEFVRGYIHYEADGNPMDHEDHDDLQTWSMKAHWHAGISPYQFGKRTPKAWGEGESNLGWTPHDDQHRSMLNLQAVYALTGIPTLRVLIEHIAELDACNVRHRSHQAFGADRAAGRLSLCYAGFLPLFEEGSRPHIIFSQMLASLLKRIEDNWEGGKHDNPVKWLTLVSDARIYLKDPGGKLLPGAMIWQCGLAAIGFYAAFKQTGDNRWRDLCYELTRTVVRYGYRNSRPFNYVHVPDVVKGTSSTLIANPAYQAPGDVSQQGVPIPDEYYGAGYSEKNDQGNSILNVPGEHTGVDLWTFPAALIFAELETELNRDPEAGDLAAGIISHRTGNTLAESWRDAEWYAAVKPSVYAEATQVG